MKEHPRPCHQGAQRQSETIGSDERARGGRSSPEFVELAVGNGGAPGMLVGGLVALGVRGLVQNGEGVEGVLIGATAS